MMKSWKSIARPPTRVQPRRDTTHRWLHPQHALTKVYRLGAECQRSWSAEIQAVLPLQPRSAGAAADRSTQLKIEFLRILVDMHPEKIFSVPDVSSLDVARVQDARAEEAMNILESVCGGEHIFFEVTMSEPGRRKQLQTSLTRQARC